jgi:hypothetical protein
MKQVIVPFNIKFSSKFRKWLKKENVSKKDWVSDPMNTLATYYDEWIKVSNFSPSTSEQQVIKKLHQDIRKISSVLHSLTKKFEINEVKRNSNAGKMDTIENSHDLNELLNEVDFREYPILRSPKKRKKVKLLIHQKKKRKKNYKRGPRR